MSDEPPPPPPRVPPVLPPPPAAGPSAAPPRPHASPRKRFLVGLVVSAALCAAGTFLLLGLPGILPLTIANTVITLFGGKDALGRLTDSSWAAALVVTVAWPVPFAPALAFFTWLRPRERPVLHWALAFAVAFFWAVGVAFVVLLAK